MTYEELKKIKISDVVKTSDLTDLSKTCLGIIKSSTIKDDEVILFINAAILDLKRQEQLFFRFRSKALLPPEYGA